MIIVYILLSVLLVSLISFVGALTLSLRPEVMKRAMFALVSLATGALFGNALFHLIPDALREASSEALATLGIALGLLAFFVLEKFLSWRHHHGLAEGSDCEECDVHDGRHQVRPVGPLVLVADGIHNVTDGVLIAGAYLIAPEAGIATTIAVLLHEIPQEIGDFSLLLHAGYTRGKALVFNFLSAIPAFIGALAVLVASTYAEAWVPYLVAFAAGNILYIAGSDLLPELHKTADPRRSLSQLVWLVLGLLLMFALAYSIPMFGQSDERAVERAFVVNT